jgi:hypothetical protein
MSTDAEKRSREEIFVQQDLKVGRITSKRRKTKRQGVNHPNSTQGNSTESIAKDSSGEQTENKDKVGSARMFADFPQTIPIA